jgi:acid phosphatase class B
MLLYRNRLELRTEVPKAFEKLGELLVEGRIKRSKRLFNKAFIKKIPFDVSLDHGIEVLLLPAQGACSLINMNDASQMICDRIILLHGRSMTKQDMCLT